MNYTDSILTESKEVAFGWLDSLLFASMLIFSTLIGAYFGFWGKKGDTQEEYLHGGKKMHILPTAVSLMVSNVSTATLTLAPLEIYLYGTIFWFMCLSSIIGITLAYFFILPVFYELQHFSVNQYLNLRFNRSVCLMASFLTVLSSLIANPTLIYISSLAFGLVTGINFRYIIPVITVLCVFYTTLGGLRGVVWADVLQGAIMLVALIVVTAVGVINSGGFDVVWQRNIEGGRIRALEYGFSPFTRMTITSFAIGFPLQSMGYNVMNQHMMQRFISIPTFRKIGITVIIFEIGIIIYTSLVCFTGLVMYANYHKCDPIQSQAISKPEQLTVYYAMDIAGSLPGLSGLYIAAIISAALSTLSSMFNGMGAIIFEDFMRPCIKKHVSDKYANNSIRLITIVYGIVCLALTFTLETMATVLPFAIGAGGVLFGAVVGVFSFGMLYPMGNSKGALAGSIFSLIFVGWIAIGRQKAEIDGRLTNTMLPRSVEECVSNTTLSDMTNTVRAVEPEDEVFFLYRISFLFYTLMSVIVVFIVGAIVSYFTKSEDHTVDPVLITPPLRKYIKNNKEDQQRAEPAEMKLLNVIK